MTRFRGLSRRLGGDFGVLGWALEGGNKLDVEKKY